MGAGNDSVGARSYRPLAGFRGGGRGEGSHSSARYQCRAFQHRAAIGDAVTADFRHDPLRPIAIYASQSIAE
jgi:hypothetical protein